MSACPAVRSQLAAFVAGELSPALRAEVREHLHRCCGCRGEAGLLQRAHSALGELAHADADPRQEAMFAGLHRAILDSTVAAGPVGVAEPVSPRMLVPSSRVVAVTAAALLLSVGFLIGAQAGGPSGAAGWPSPSGPVISSDSAVFAGREPIVVVPYAGPRVELRPLGFERTALEVQGPAVLGDVAGAAGMLARRRLRTLVEEGAPIPPAEPPRVSTIGADAVPR